jgi:hypothetical protein
MTNSEQLWKAWQQFARDDGITPRRLQDFKLRIRQYRKFGQSIILDPPWESWIKQAQPDRPHVAPSFQNGRENSVPVILKYDQPAKMWFNEWMPDGLLKPLLLDDGLPAMQLFDQRATLRMRKHLYGPSAILDCVAEILNLMHGQKMRIQEQLSNE